MKYRFMGKEKLLSIGLYPEIGLARARKEQLAARELLVDGLDPSNVKQQEREKQVELHSRTFRALTEEFLKKQEKEGRANSTVKKNRWVLAMAIAQIGNEPVTALKAPAVLKVLKKVEARGTYETARRLKVMIGAAMGAVAARRRSHQQYVRLVVGRNAPGVAFSNSGLELPPYRPVQGFPRARERPARRFRPLDAFSYC
jgi:hypothetical protein